MRKLAIGAAGFSTSIIAACYLSPPDFVNIVLMLSFGVVGFLLLFRYGKKRLWAVIMLLGMTAGLANFTFQNKLTKIAADEADGMTCYVKARIISEPVGYEKYSTCNVKLIDGDVPRLNGIMYDYSCSLDDFSVGDTIYFRAKVNRADIKYGKDYDYYNSKDIYLKLTCHENPVLFRRSGLFTCFPTKLNGILGRQIDKVFNSDTAPFMKSLLIGSRNDLYKDEALSVHLSRSGFSHVVAVSGMHIAFLIGLIQLIFGSSHRSSLICVILVWFFVLLTGASPSAVRAGIMQTMVLLAPLLRRENDLPTSLLFALALILLKNPLAAKSVSLQLSFGAIAGILLFGSRIYDALIQGLGIRPENKVFSYIIGIFASSVSVSVFTIPLCAIHFGYVSILSFVTNIVALWSISICFSLGWVCCALSFIPFIGPALVWLCSALVRYIRAVTAAVSSVSWGVLYMSTRGAWLWLAVTYTAFILFYFAFRDKWKKVLIPSLISALLFAGIIISVRVDYLFGDPAVAVVDVEQGLSVSLISDDVTVVIDSGNIYSSENAGELTGEYLFSRGRTSVDVLILTHFHSDHINGVTTLLELMPVDRIIIPELPEEDPDLLREILDSADRHGTGVSRISADTSIKAADMSLMLYYPPKTGDDEGCLTALADIGGKRIFISGDSTGEAEEVIMKQHKINNADILVVGHHGSKYSSYTDFLTGIGADCALISTGYNTYGHPAEETLERLVDAGYNVIRTDKIGTIELRIR